MLTPHAEPGSFLAPGPGHWDLDRSHYFHPATPILQELQVQGVESGMRRLFAELGMPADTLSVRFVHGYMYTRLRPLIRPDKPSAKLPPLPLLKLVSRLHPEMRRRAAKAEATLKDKPWRAVAEDWHRRIKPDLERRNLALQDVHLESLSDDGLARHFDAVMAHIRETWELHFYLHGFDLGPIGLYLLEGQAWGLSSAELLPLLKGASPSTSAPARALTAIRSAVAASGRRPTTLEELRGIGPDVAGAVDDYLRSKGSVLFTRYDVDGLTLREMPAVVLATILDGRPADDATEVEALTEGVRARVPARDHALFDERLAEARVSMDLRDDNGPTTAEWPLGLLRYALLEVGRRVAARGDIAEAEHVFDAQSGEVTALLLGASGPSGAVLAARAAERRAASELRPPSSLGAAEPAPPLEILPYAQGRMIGAVNTVMREMGMAGTEPPAPATTSDGARTHVTGCGVGTVSYRGKARQARSAEDAIGAMDPGDVLVVPYTTPAYNVVLSIAGAVVTSDGGPLSHAAVLARELGIPAVVGAVGALDIIPDGAEVEVDPVAGTVRVLSAA